MARNKKNETIYFDSFVSGVESACSAASMLYTTFDNYNPENLPASIEAMHKIEHSADLAKHAVMEQLAREFLPPIDREDIILLSNMIDNVTDSIEDVLLRLYMFNIKSLREDALRFVKVIEDCCAAMKNMMQEFANFRKSKDIHNLIIEINHLEEEGDKLYTDAMHRLYSEGNDPIAILVWTELFDRLERCCDSCEDAADVVESVIMKNS